MKIDQALSEEFEFARSSGHALPVIVTVRNAEDVKSLLAGGIEAGLTYQSIPAFSAQLTVDQIEQLAAMPEVQLIELDTGAKALHKK